MKNERNYNNLFKINKYSDDKSEIEKLKGSFFKEIK